MKQSYVSNLLCGVMLLFASSCAPDVDKSLEQAKPANGMDSVSYIIGLDYGQGVKARNIDINRLMVYKGFHDGMKGVSLFTEPVRDSIIQEFNEILAEKEEEEIIKEVELNKQQGAAFLAENLGQAGVTELPSGLQYKVLKEGVGSSPSPDALVRIHYRAMYTDRTTFDMSYDRGPAEIQLGNVITGLSEGISLMKKGGIYELYIPSHLAYGDQNFANVIPGGSTLIYTIELLEIIE